MIPCVRPYDSLIFDFVQKGNVFDVMTLLQNGDASVYDVDPYGLGLLYVRQLAVKL